MKNEQVIEFVRTGWKAMAPMYMTVEHFQHYLYTKEHHGAYQDRISLKGMRTWFSKHFWMDYENSEIVFGFTFVNTDHLPLDMINEQLTTWYNYMVEIMLQEG